MCCSFFPPKNLWEMWERAAQAVSTLQELAPGFLPTWTTLSGTTVAPAGLEGVQKLFCDLQPSKEATWVEIGFWEPLTFNKKLGRNSPRHQYVLGDTHWEAACQK